MNKIMFRQFNRGSLLTLFAIVLVVIVTLALKPTAAYAADADTIILYKNGTLVLQTGTDPQESLYGDVEEVSEIEFYTGDDPGRGTIAWTDSMKQANKIVFSNGIRFHRYRELFAGFTKLRTIERIENVSTQGSTDMNDMFQGCSSLESLDLSSFDTSNVTFMGSMFQGCSSLESLDLSSFDTSNATLMGSMFQGCSSLESLDLSSFDTSSTTHMTRMFAGCSSLTQLDTSHFRGKNCMFIAGMFEGCSSLKSIDLSSFGTAEKQWGLDEPELISMFDGCVALETINLAGFSLHPLDRPYTIMDNMFRNCRSLSKITLPDGYNFTGLLPTPSAFYIPGATGRWLNTKGQAFTSSTIPAFQADTYVAEGTKAADLTKPALPQKPTDAKPGTTSPTTSPAVTMPASLSKASVIVKNRSYTGKTLKPSSVTVKLNGKTLRKNVDYTVSCKGGKKVGSYQVTIKGKGAYRGSKRATFKIVPKGTSISKLKEAKKGFAVAWKKQTQETDGYQVRYSTSKSMKGAKTKTAKGRAKSNLKIAKLKGGKKYYVQVRTYKKTGGKTYYSSWSKAKAVRTTK